MYSNIHSPLYEEALRGLVQLSPPWLVVYNRIWREEQAKRKAAKLKTPAGAAVAEDDEEDEDDMEE